MKGDQTCFRPAKDDHLIYEDLMRLLRDAVSSEQDPERQLIRWLVETLEYCDLLVQKRVAVPKEVRFLFWVRLYGVAADGNRRLNDYESAHACTFEEFGDPNEATLHSMVSDMLGILQQIRDALTSDEWIYVTFRRHFESHPFQDMFRLSYKKGKLARPQPILEQAYSVEEMKAAIRRVRATYNDDDAATAADFATRVRPFLLAMREGIQEYFDIQKPYPSVNAKRS